MSVARSPCATLLRRKPVPFLERSVCRPTTPVDETKKLSPRTSEQRQRDCPDGGHDKVHVQRRFSIVQASDARRCLRATARRVATRQKYRAPKKREKISS